MKLITALLMISWTLTVHFVSKTAAADLPKGTVSCSNNTDCTAIAGSSCLKLTGCNRGLCSCVGTGSKLSIDPLKCVTPIVKPGDACSANTDCAGDLAACVDSVCKCAALSADNSTCVSPTILKLGATCPVLYSTCGLYAACNSSLMCACIAGYQPSSNGISCTVTTTQPKKALGEKCSLLGGILTGDISVCADNLVCSICPEDILSAPTSYKCLGNPILTDTTTSAPSSNTTSPNSASRHFGIVSAITMTTVAIILHL